MIFTGLLTVCLSVAGYSSPIVSSQNNISESNSIPQRGEKGKRPSLINAKLIKELALSDEQVAEMKAEEQTFEEKMREIRPDRKSEAQPDFEEMRKKMDELQEERTLSIKKILTEDQFVKYQAYMKKNKTERRAPDGPGGPDQFGGPGGFDD